MYEKKFALPTPQQTIHIKYIKRTVKIKPQICHSISKRASKLNKVVKRNTSS